MRAEARVTLYALIGILLLGAIGVQVYYARMYAPQATRAAKVVWGFNIALLSGLLVGVVWLAYVQGTR